MSVKLEPYIWFFPEAPAGMRVGFTDGNMDYFTNDTNKCLAKEICQNSIDANLDRSSPTIVEFHLFKTERNNIPQLDDLSLFLEKCKEYGQSMDNGEDIVDFFNNAITETQKEFIPVLRISDFNTTGLIGADKKKTPWDSFTKTTGESDKSDDKGGSKGVGKFSLFAASLMRTIFVSTYDKDYLSASEGIARLIGYENDPIENTFVYGYGWLGIGNGNPVLKQLNLDPEFKRKDKEFGTDLFVIGFDESSDWKKEIVIGAINSFFVAIHGGKLIVKVEDIEINKETLPLLIEEYRKDFDKDEESYVSEYYRVLTASEEECKTIRKDIAGKGDICLKLMLHPDFSRRVAMVRSNGMKIFNKKGISSAISFSGVMIVEGQKLNGLLRKIEDPQHSSWKPTKKTFSRGIYTDKEVKKVLDEINSTIMSEFKKLRPNSSGEEIDPKLGAYLATPIKEGESNNYQEVLSDHFTQFTKKKTNIKAKTKANQDEIEYNPNDRRHRDADELDENGELVAEKVKKDEQGNIDAQENTGTEQQKKEAEEHQEPKVQTSNDENAEKYSRDGKDARIQLPKKIIEISCSKIRSICLNKDKGEYVLSFSPRFSAKEAFVELFISAESRPYKAIISSASYKVKDNMTACSIQDGYRIKLGEIKKNQLIKLYVTLSDIDEFISLEADVYGYKK